MVTVVVERAVVNDAGERFAVRRENGHVRIIWACGEKRTFTMGEMEAIIEHLQMLTAYPDVWLAGRDDFGGTFYARIVNGILYADTVPNEDAAECGGVPWSEMCETLRRMMS